MSNVHRDGELNEDEQRLWSAIEKVFTGDPEFMKQIEAAQNDPADKKISKAAVIAWGSALLAVLVAGGSTHFASGATPSETSANLAQAKAEILANTETLRRLGLCAKELGEKETWLADREADGLTTNGEPPAALYRLGERFAYTAEIACEPPNRAEAVYRKNFNGMEVVVYPSQLELPPQLMPTAPR
jgi:hypothetical protein